MLSYAFKSSDNGVYEYLHTRSDDKVFNLARLKALTRVLTVLVRELLFADDATLVSHTPVSFQNLVNHVTHACYQCGITISLKKTEIMTQDVKEAPNVTIGDYTLKVVDNCNYLGRTVTSNLSLDSELKKRIGKAAAAMTKLSKRVWENNMLTKATEMSVHRACVLSTVLYSSES